MVRADAGRLCRRGTVLTARGAALLAALLTPGVGCYSPAISDGQFKCASAGRVCPSGFTCVCSACYSNANASGISCSLDLALPPDQTMPVADLGVGADLAVAGDLGIVAPCTNGNKTRGPSDPQLERVAFCPAAWRSPGIVSTQTPCGREPGPTGRNNQNVDCSAEDNCGVGWHICLNETELSMRGMNRSHCQIYDGQNVFWATRLAGVPSMGSPPACTGGIARVLMGCGGYGIGVAGDCAIVTIALVDTPMSGDECAMTTGGVWQCPNVTGPTPETAVVIKTSPDKGGVICCRDN